MRLSESAGGLKAGRISPKFQPAITDCKATQYQAAWPREATLK